MKSEIELFFNELSEKKKEKISRSAKIREIIDELLPEDGKREDITEIINISSDIHSKLFMKLHAGYNVRPVMNFIEEYIQSLIQGLEKKEMSLSELFAALCFLDSDAEDRSKKVEEIKDKVCRKILEKERTTDIIASVCTSATKIETEKEAIDRIKEGEVSYLDAKRIFQFALIDSHKRIIAKKAFPNCPHPMEEIKKGLKKISRICVKS